MSTDNSAATSGLATSGPATSPAPAATGQAIDLPDFFSLDLVVKHLSTVRTTQPVAALAAANQHRAGLTEIFLQAVERGVAEPTQDFAEHGMLFNYATYFLAKWREPRACPLFLEWFSLPGEEAMELGGDTVTHQGARFLASVCGSDPAALKRLVENRAASNICRGQAILALAILTAWGEVSREDIEGYFMWLALEGLERKAGAVWIDLVVGVTGLEYLPVYPELRRASGEGLIPAAFIASQGLDELERAPRGELIKAFTDRNPPITDILRETRWWAGFQRQPAEVIPGEGRLVARSSQPYMAPSKVGRNDSCPCGSGKKYKKCCGR